MEMRERDRDREREREHERDRDSARDMDKDEREKYGDRDRERDRDRDYGQRHYLEMRRPFIRISCLSRLFSPSPLSCFSVCFCIFVALCLVIFA
jgi:hypothetical protein